MERATASWWRGRRRGGEGSGLEAWRFQRDKGRLRDFNVTGGGFVVESGESGGVVVESGGVVVEGAEVWRRRQYVGFQRERERGICSLCF